jgi:hypothetical protein
MLNSTLLISSESNVSVMQTTSGVSASTIPRSSSSLGSKLLALKYSILNVSLLFHRLGDERAFALHGMLVGI